MLDAAKTENMMNIDLPFYVRYTMKMIEVKLIFIIFMLVSMKQALGLKFVSYQSLITKSRILTPYNDKLNKLSISSGRRQSLFKFDEHIKTFRQALNRNTQISAVKQSFMSLSSTPKLLTIITSVVLSTTKLAIAETVNESAKQSYIQFLSDGISKKLGITTFFSLIVAIAALSRLNNKKPAPKYTSPSNITSQLKANVVYNNENKTSSVGPSKSNQNFAKFRNVLNNSSKTDTTPDVVDSIEAPGISETVVSDGNNKASSKSILENSNGFFNMFKKQDKGRPTQLLEALGVLGDKTYSYKMAVLQCIINCVPQGYIPDWDVYKEDTSEEVALDRVIASQEISKLSAQEAASAFADVVNAMIVALVDIAADTLKAKSNIETLAALDILNQFVEGTGSLYEKAGLGETTIDPVVYNGSTRKFILENLYYTYAKKCISIRINQSNTDSLDRIQKLLGVKDSKKVSIDQRVFKELLQEMMSGKGEGSKLMESLKGSEDSSNLANMFGDSQEQLMGRGGLNFDPDMLKELQNLDPEKLKEMTSSALNNLKTGLANGTITKKDVEIIENSMGVSMKQLSEMISSGQIEKSKLEETGFGEFADLFEDLANVK